MAWNRIYIQSMDQCNTATRMQSYKNEEMNYVGRQNIIRRSSLIFLIFNYFHYINSSIFKSLDGPIFFPSDQKVKVSTINNQMIKLFDKTRKILWFLER